MKQGSLPTLQKRKLVQGVNLPLVVPVSKKTLGSLLAVHRDSG